MRAGVGHDPRCPTPGDPTRHETQYERGDDGSP